MNFDSKRYFELMKYSHAITSKGKLISEENREIFFEILEYQIIIENHIFWEDRQKFLSAINDFINEKIDAEEFRSYIWDIRNRLLVVSKAFQTNFAELEKFEPNSRSEEFYNFISIILSDVEVMEPSNDDDDEYELSEKWLKDSLNNALLQIIYKYFDGK